MLLGRDVMHPCVMHCGVTSFGCEENRARCCNRNLLGRFGSLVDSSLGNCAERLIGLLLFVESLPEKPLCIIHAHFFGPCAERSVA